MSEFNVGDKVMMNEDKSHADNSGNFPAKGTIGVVIQCSPHEKLVLVNWGKDSGVDLNFVHKEYAWWCGEPSLEKVDANTQKEVCNMSKFHVGDKVVFTNAEKHKQASRVYPAVGTVGTVKKIDGEGLLVNWGDAKGVDVYSDGTKTWWCRKGDVKPTYDCEECTPTDDEVWEMLKPKMSQFVRAGLDIDMYSSAVKSMVVAAYRSGYGRATKGRSFIIKPKADEKPSTEKSIDAVLGGKMIVTVYKEDNTYDVANFTHSDASNGDVKIYGGMIYDSEGESWFFGFNTINDTDCEMYVAIPFSEVVEQFDSDSIKALYCEKPKALCHIKPWTIGKYNGMVYFSNRTCAFVEFKHEDGNSLFYPEIHRHEFKALVPICDYLRVNGVNV